MRRVYSGKRSYLVAMAFAADCETDDADITAVEREQVLLDEWPRRCGDKRRRSSYSCRLIFFKDIQVSYLVLIYPRILQYSRSASDTQNRTKSSLLSSEPCRSTR